jgi:hypothetical protein
MRFEVSRVLKDHIITEVIDIYRRFGVI